MVAPPQYGQAATAGRRSRVVWAHNGIWRYTLLAATALQCGVATSPRHPFDYRPLRSLDELTERYYPRLRHKNEPTSSFPTHYRANTVGRLSRLLGDAGFTHVDFRLMEGQPSYLGFHPVAFRLGVIYERVVNRAQLGSQLRHTILVRARRQERVVP